MFAWYLAYALRFNFEIPADHLAIMKLCLPGVVMVQVAGFYFFSLYRGIWRFASVVDLQRIVISVALSSLLITTTLFMLRSNFVVPRSVLIIDPAILILLMGGSRFVYRAIKEHQLYGIKASRGEPVIIVGAGQTAITLARELSQGEAWRVVGLLDEDQSLHRREVSGFRVLGGVSSLGKLHQRFGFKNLIIATPDLDHVDQRSILEAATSLEVDVLTVPGLDDLISGRLTVSQIRPVDVEDLLGRDTVSLDNSGLQQLIGGQAVLVSGAGGSIGSELCRQIVKFKPSHLICLDISEYALYQLEQELSGRGLSAELVYVVGDVKHASRLDKLLAHYQPRVVFHAAAYKHVPLMENDNVSEAFNNNVLGTYTLANACKKAKVDKFVLISTDKAVNPTNVMGATKRLAEMVCQGLQDKKGTRFVMVRFGNVLGSSGSVIPKFRDQIKAGGPITVTHPEITRYFMSIPEAAQLVMQAGLMGEGGEIFVLDMGEPVKIVDLAKDMIKLSGFSEDEIRIEFSGLRPGEKLYEELLVDDEHTLPTPHEKLRIASARVVDEKWVDSLLKWISTTLDKDEQLVKQELKTWVEEYQGDVNAR
jgi:FlaA1/EpsC-like NDP-sugar epimerase